MYAPGQVSNPNRKLLLASFAFIGAVVAAITYFLILPTANYHFQEVILNFYSNGPMDFSVNVTGLVRGLGIVALACMVVGLLVGSVIGLGKAGMLLERKGRHLAPDAKIDVALLKSGLVSGIATNEGVRFELTGRGRQFMREYEKTVREISDRTPEIVAT